MPRKPRIPDEELSPEELAKRIARREYIRRWREANPDKHREYDQRRYHKLRSTPGTDAFVRDVFRMAVNGAVSSAVQKGLLAREDLVASPTELFYGTSDIDSVFEEARLHVERLWEPPAEGDANWMRWSSYGARTGCWNLDHRLGISNFTCLRDPRVQKEVFGYRNVRPMWWIDNIRNEHNQPPKSFRWVRLKTDER